MSDVEAGVMAGGEGSGLKSPALPSEGVSEAALVEGLSDAVHDAWITEQRRRGRTSSVGRDGEEYMVPYSWLSEAAKELDRVTVRAVLDALTRCGYVIVEEAK